MAKGKLKYSKPVITRIRLEPEQAILQACVEDAGLIKWALISGGTQVWCQVGPHFASCNFKGSGLGYPFAPSVVSEPGS